MLEISDKVDEIAGETLTSMSIYCMHDVEDSLQVHNVVHAHSTIQIVHGLSVATLTSLVCHQKVNTHENMSCSMAFPLLLSQVACVGCRFGGACHIEMLRMSHILVDKDRWMERYLGVAPAPEQPG